MLHSQKIIMAEIFFEKLVPEICDRIKKPQPAVLSSPLWWKEIPKYNYDSDSDFVKNIPHREYATIRSCPAITDAFNFGYILFTPLDIFIDTTDNESINWHLPDMPESVYGSNKHFFFSFHQPNEFPGFKIPNGYHDIIIKINPFFGIKTEKGYSSWITSPMNQFDLPFTALDAIIDTDEFVSRFAYAVMIKKGFRGVIKSGTPLVQVIPFKREDFNSKIIEKDDSVLIKQNSIIYSVFTSGYKKFFWKRKRFN